MLGGQILHHFECKQQKDHVRLWFNDKQGRQGCFAFILEAETIVTFVNFNNACTFRPLWSVTIFFGELQLQEEDIHDKTNKRHLPLFSTGYFKGAQLVSTVHIATNSGLYGADINN